LTDTVVAPLIARTREQFERQFARKDAELSERESGIRKMRDALAKTRKGIDAEIARNSAPSGPRLPNPREERFAALWPAILRSATDAWPNCNAT
jgi:hypothetical protein